MTVIGSDCAGGGDSNGGDSACGLDSAGCGSVCGGDSVWGVADFSSVGSDRASCFDAVGSVGGGG